MSIYKENDPVYNLARASYEMAREKQPNLPEWGAHGNEKRRKLAIRVAREQRGEFKRK